MGKFCEHYELLILFDDYKVIDPEIKTVRYIIHYDNNMELTFFISPYDDYVCVTLIDKTTQTMVFSIGIDNLEEIVCKENKIFLYKENQLGEPFLVVQIKPTLSLSSFGI